MALEEVRDQLAAAVSHAAPINPNEALHRQVGDRRANRFESSGNSALNQQSGFRQVQTKHPVHLAAPMLGGMAGKKFASLKAHSDSEQDTLGARRSSGPGRQSSLKSSSADGSLLASWADSQPAAVLECPRP